ncbi:hypothetical protein CRENBAI_024279 [Crenichthys baileyi]|uniref:Uncharacterized protein n=1 Tax=Crenichthys baileyi TaxID=28760 RepID=A0AAV9SND2_9TELE
MEKEDEYTEGGMDRVWRMGEEWMEGWKEECDRWVVPGQSWEGPERLASQGHRVDDKVLSCAHVSQCQQFLTTPRTHPVSAPYLADTPAAGSPPWQLGRVGSPHAIQQSAGARAPDRSPSWSQPPNMLSWPALGTAKWFCSCPFVPLP